MGSGNSHGDLAIQLECGSYFSGQEITGMIHISIKSALDSSTLYLRFCGKEKTAWTETRTETTTDAEGKSTSTTVTDYYGGKSKICNFSKAIYVWHNMLLPGQYSLPFSFTIPDNIPSSFHYNRGSTQAHISYSVRGLIQSMSNSRIKGKTQVFIKQAVGMFNLNLKLEKFARMRSWCFGKGNCAIKVEYPQDTYNPSQIANFYVDVDNSESKVDVTGINCILYFTLRMKDNHYGSTFIKEEVIRETVRLNIPSGTRVHQDSGIAISLNLPTKLHTLNEMFTTKGKLIECIYTNVVSAVMDAYCMCCGDNPSIETFMNIVPNIILQPSAPVAPPGWSPEILSSVAIQYEPSAPEYVYN